MLPEEAVRVCACKDLSRCVGVFLCDKGLGNDCLMLSCLHTKEGPPFLGQSMAIKQLCCGLSLRNQGTQSVTLGAASVPPTHFGLCGRFLALIGICLIGICSSYKLSFVVGLEEFASADYIYVPLDCMVLVFV